VIAYLIGVAVGVVVGIAIVIFYIHQVRQARWLDAFCRAQKIELERLCNGDKKGDESE